MIKKIPKDDPEVRAIGQHGTEVVLQVRRSADLSDVESLVRFWLVIPKCEVTCKTDDSEPVSIGFPNAQAVVDYYYRQEKAKTLLKSAEVRIESEPGIELAYVVSKSDFADVWDFVRMDENEESDTTSDPNSFLSAPPGICVEGVRVRSVPAGYDRRIDSPWTFANLTGREVPKTNVARSDIEQTPELDHALLQVYSLLGKHIKSEFDRLREKKTGIVEAAWEADYLRTWGLEQSPRSSNQKFREAMSEVRVIALEDENACRAVTHKELESFEKVWSVDSRLVRNLEGVCGILGIDQPAGNIIAGLSRAIQPMIPAPRLLGSSKDPLTTRDIGKIRIYPEERSYRIDICWEKKKLGRWIEVPNNLIHLNKFTYSHHIDSIWITSNAEISSECPDYDLVFWRRWCLILATSPIHDLLDILGMNEGFSRWLSFLLEDGEIPIEQRPILRQHLARAKGSECDELLSRLVLPFERRFGNFSENDPRGFHIFSDFSDFLNFPDDW